MSSDDVRQVAFDHAAPAPERFDANAEMMRLYTPLANQLIPSPQVQTMIDVIHDGLEQEALMMKAGRAGTVVQFPGRTRDAPAKGMRSVYVDDLQIFASGEYFEKPSPVGFDGLRTMVRQTPILNAILLTRIRQISRFCQPSEDGGPGFEIRHVDRKHKLTSTEQEASQLLGRFFQNCGWEFNPTRRKMLKRDNFRQFMAKLVNDSLTMDACPIEREMKRDARKGIDGLYAVDGTTVRLCTEEGYQGDDRIYSLQVIQGRIATAYTHQQLIYEVRNPQADVRLAGYGMGEPELLIRVVTGFLNALTYNINGFDQNAIPKGILQLTGEYSTEDLSAFKRYWNSMVKGINNAWALPVMVSKDPEGQAKFEKFGVEFNEIMFSKWMTFLTSIACSIYGMAPDEINFESFSASKSSLSGDDTSEKLANSKDSGLRPDMAFFESTFTDFVVTDFDEKFCFRWVGLEEEDETKAWEGRKLTLSVDELRAEQGYERWSAINTEGPDLGGAPLNPQLIGPWMQAQQAASQDFGTAPDEGGEGGQPGAPNQGQGDGDGPGQDGGRGEQPKSPGGGEFGAGGDRDGDFGKALAPPEIFSVGE